MNIDGLTLAVLTRELSDALVNGQIQRLMQADKTTLVLKIHTLEGTKHLIITVGQRPACYLGAAPLDTTKEATSLVMFLRKHIEGSRITTIEQINGDRILHIIADKLALDGTLTSNHMYIELMGKYSNCIIVQDGTILESLIHVTPLMNRVRSVAPKLPYELPPNTERGSLFDFTEEELTSLVQNFYQSTVSTTIRHLFNGFGPLFMAYVCHLATVEESLPLDESNIHVIAPMLGQALFQLQKELKAAQGLYQYKTTTGKRLLSPINLEGSGLHTIEESHYTATISEALEADVTRERGIHTAGHDLEKLLLQSIEREEGRQQKIQAELDDTSFMDQYKEYGDLLMIYSYLPSHYQESIDVDNILQEPVEKVTIPLTPHLSITENAQAYYKQYTKLKNRTHNGAYQLEQSKLRLTYLQSILYSLSLATTKEGIEDIRQECEEAGLIKKSKKPTPFKVKKDNFIHISIPHGEVYIGRNNRQNEYLSTRWAKPNDLWLHTQQLQGSHVILQSTVEPDIKMIEEAAQYAAYFSKGRHTSKVTVDYTLVKHLKKPPASPMGYVIYNTHNDIVVEPKQPEGYEE